MATNPSEPGLLGNVGNFLLQSHAFGDPRETFRRNTPEGLLQYFDEEEQERLGSKLQSQFRMPGSRSAVRSTFREDVTGVAEAEAAQAKLDQYQDFVARHPGLNDDQRRLLLQAGPETGMELLTEAQTVSQGQALVNPLLGDARFKQPTTDIQEYEYGRENPGFAEAQGAGEGDSVRAQKIADWMRLNPGLSERDAVGIVDEHIQIRQDPDTGRNFIVDMNGTQRPVRTVGVPEAPGMEGTPGMDPGTDVSATTGVGGGIRRFANLVSDAIGLGTPAEQTDKAYVNLQTWNQMAKLHIADHVTEGRRSNLLLQMLDDIMLAPDSVFQGSENAKRKLQSVDRLLAQQVAQYESTVENEHVNRPADVQAARRSASVLNGLRQDVKVMLEGFGKGGKPGEGEARRPDASGALPPDVEDILRKYE